MILNCKKNSLSYHVSIAFIALLSIFSVIAYKERMFFVDPAWITYNIINAKSLIIAEHRYGAFITQIFPLIGVYLGLSLKTILILYSFSFYLFYLSAALIIGFKFKQYGMAILLALYLSLFVSDVYYWPNNEVHQGITWMFLFFALYLYRRDKHNAITLVLSFLLATLAISSHLLVSVPFLFLWIYFHSNSKIKELVKDKTFIVFTLLIFALVVFRYKLSDAGWYDPVKLQGVKNITLESILAAFKSGQAKSFGQLLLSNYWLAIPIFILSCLIIFNSKKYFNLVLIVSFTIGYFVLICITFPDAYDRSLRFYMESEWAALSIIISTPLAMWLSNNKKASVILLFIFAIRLIYIFGSYDYFHTRFNNLKTVLHVIQNQGINKALVIENPSKSKENYIMDWGLPIESLMLSKVEGKNVQATFKIVYDTIPSLHTTDSFYSCFDIQPVKILNKSYFAIDSTQYYKTFKGVDNLVKDVNN